MNVAKEARIGLLGSPNSGKTTLFNALTGLRAKTGNYPGVTVDRRAGTAACPDGAVKLLDLPGTYSLNAMSQDEAIAVQAMRGEIEGEKPLDGVVMVADATTLERSLPLLGEAMLQGLPLCLVLTMVDELKARGGELDLFRLQNELGIQVIPVVGNRGLGLDDLRALLPSPESWISPKSPPAKAKAEHFQWADQVFKDACRARPQASKVTASMDRVLLHPVSGGLIFFIFMACFFQAIFSWAMPAVDFLDSLVHSGADWVIATFPESWATQLFADGILRGVGAVLVFTPQIALLFLLILTFEACGYLARAAFVTDRLMGWAGLEGRCFVSLLSSFACAVPGIMATRTIPSPRDRLATMMVAPLMTCSARLPVYALLIGAFIEPTPLLGPFTSQGAAMFGLYALGVVSAIVFAALFKRGLLKGATLPFYLELPPYRFPSFSSILLQVWHRLLLFFKRAGTVILGASLALWLLLTFPKAATEGLTDTQAQQAQIEASYAASIGKAIEPAILPLGWDWRVGVGLIGSFAAREVFVSTMAQVYALPEQEDDSTDLADVLVRGSPGAPSSALSFASAMALLVFFVYALQCISTVAVLVREAGGWRYGLFALAYQTGFAWLAAFATYRILL